MFTDVLEVLAASVIKANISETSLDFYQTAQCNIREDSHIYTCRCEYLTSYLTLSALL
jgi:hypothetical protein